MNFVEYKFLRCKTNFFKFNAIEGNIPCLTHTLIGFICNGGWGGKKHFQASQCFSVSNVQLFTPLSNAPYTSLICPKT